MDQSPDIVIIGSGIGGATVASSLAPSGARILILERGVHLKDTPEARDDRAIFQRGFYRTTEEWVGPDGKRFRPGNFYYVGGNSKFYGAVMYRYREADFSPRAHMDGHSPGWPISYAEMEPWYGRAESLFRVRGLAGEDPSDPPRSGAFPLPPVPDEPAAIAVRARLTAAGMHPASLPLAVDHLEWLKRAQTPWDGFPNTGDGKVDAENGPLAEALAHPNVSLTPGAEVLRLETDASGKTVVAAIVMIDGQETRIAAKTFIVAAGAINSAALLLRSANAKHPNGLANGSDQVGRNFMNHNSTALIAIDPRLPNRSIYQKTLCFNDFYSTDAETGFPLGNVQHLGKITGPILKANLRYAPEFLTRLIAGYTFDWYLTSEDLPNPESRVKVVGRDIHLHWQRSNYRAHTTLVQRTRAVMRRAGFPIVLTQAFDKSTPSHQCGTARMGLDGATSVVTPDCQSHDIANLFITDAAVLPTSAAVNPALTIAAVALRAAHAMKRLAGA